MKSRDLIQQLLKVAEKAANLARTVRAEKALFDLLVQEKTGNEKNKRFVQDFKTLGDVLVQQTVQHDLGMKFPSLAGHIYGEESNKFTNVLGETVTVEIKPSVQETSSLLAEVLNDDVTAATLLAEVVHEEVTIDTDLSNTDLDTEIPDGSVGVWIDPIDSTAQYIHGIDSVQDTSGVYTCGLQSVLVLIGVYDLHSGTPVAGVLNQPFSKQQADSRWTGRHFWGLCHGSVRCHLNLPIGKPTQNLVISASESQNVSDILGKSFGLLKASGGGYKLLCVVENLVKGFVLSKSSCFKWDTCAPHAVLQALGGGVLDLQRALDIICSSKDLSVELLKDKLIKECQLLYHKPDQSELDGGQTWCNSGGILGYRDIAVAMDILQMLKNSM